MPRFGSLGEQFGIDPFEPFQNINFNPMSDWRPAGHIGEIDEGYGELRLNNPHSGASRSIPVVGRHQGEFALGGVQGENDYHEWDFQAISEQLDRPDDETFDFEKLFANPTHPRTEPFQGLEANIKPMLRYGTYSVGQPGHELREPLVASRMTRKSHMREIEHPVTGATDPFAAYREDEVADFPVDYESVIPAFPETAPFHQSGPPGADPSNKRIDRYIEAGVLSGQQILRGGVHSLIEQHDRWLKDVQGWSDEERERLG